MARPKRPVPTPAWVTPEMLDNRERLRVARMVGVARRPYPSLVATTAAPIDKGLIGYPKPRLATRNDNPLPPIWIESADGLLPDIDWAPVLAAEEAEERAAKTEKPNE